MCGDTASQFCAIVGDVESLCTYEAGVAMLCKKTNYTEHVMMFYLFSLSDSLVTNENIRGLHDEEGRTMRLAPRPHHGKGKLVSDLSSVNIDEENMSAWSLHRRMETFSI